MLQGLQPLGLDLCLRAKVTMGNRLPLSEGRI